MFTSFRLLSIAIVLVAGGAFAQGPEDEPPPRRIYVPIDDLDAVLDRDQKGVLLPTEEFQKLYDAARATAAARPNAPDAVVLSRADYAARIEGEQLLFTVTAQLTNFRDGWSQVALAAGGLGVESALLDGAPARLGRSADQPNQLLLYLSETGAHTLTLELSTPLTAVGSDKAAGFELFAAPSGVFRVTLPAGKFLSVGGMQLERPAPAEQDAAYEVPIGGFKNINLQFTDRQQQTTGDAMIFAQTAFGVFVAPGEVTWTARTGLQVYGRSIDRLVCTVPNTLEITGVESTGLESWTLGDAAGAPGRTSITLSYRQPFDGVREITFRGVVSSVAAEQWSVPDLVIEGVTSHVGRVVVQHPPGVRVQLTQASGVRPVLADGAQDASLALQYEVWQEGFSLSFTTSTKEREVHAGMTTLLDVNAAGLDLYVMLDASTLFAPLFDVRLRLPAEWTVTSGAVQGQAADWQVVPQEAGVNEVRLPLNPPLNPGETRQLTLVAHRDPETWPVEATPARLAIPEVRLPQASVVEALYGVTADDDLELLPVDVTGLDPARAADVELLNGKLQPLGKRVRLGFTYQDSVFTGQLDVARKPSRVSAATVTFFRIDRETLFSHLEAQLLIEGGGVRELQVALSEAAGTDLRFQLIRPVTIMEQDAPFRQGSFIYPPVDAVRIVEQSAAAPQDGQRTWTLQLDRRARGALVLMVDVQTPRPAGESFSPFVMNVLGADRQSGHVAVEAGNEQQVTVTATSAEGTALAIVDPVDFPPAYYRPAERVVAGYQYVRPGWQMTVAETRFDRQEVPTAVVHSAKITSVLGRTGDFQHQADLSFTAVGIQNLKLRLAAGTDLWATLIDGRPVEVRKAGNDLLITLPPVGNPEQVRSLRLMYRTQAAALDQWSGRVQQTPPQLLAVTGEGTDQELDVLRQEWTVHHPQGTLVVDSDGRFHATGDLDRDSLLGRMGQAFRAPSPRELWTGIVAVSIAVVVAWVLSLGYRRFRVLGLALSCGIVFLVGMVFLASYFGLGRAMAPRAGADIAFFNERTLGYTAESAAPTSAPMPTPMAAEADYAMPMEGAAGMGGPQGGPAGVPDFGNFQRDTGALAPADSDPFAAPETPPVTEPGPSSGMGGGGVDTAARRRELSELQSQLSGAQTRVDEFSRGDVPFRQGSFSTDGLLVQAAPQQPAAPPQVAGPGPGTLGDGSVRYVTTGGLLSLALNLEPPKDFERREFRYLGNDAIAADLNLTYADRTAGRMLTLVVAAGLAFLFWSLRNRSLASRAQLAALFVAGPLALMTIAPVAWLPVLDGLFLGGLLGVSLWLIRAIAGPCCAWFGRLGRREGTQVVKATALLVAFGLGPIASPVTAQEANPPADQAPAAPPLDTLHSQLSTPHIVVPFDPADGPTAATLVFLPHEQFLKLWNDAHPEDRRTGPAPVDGLVSDALYAARLEGEGDDARVAMTGRFVLHNLRRGQVTLPLPLGAVALGSSKLDGNAAPLVAQDGTLRIVLSDPGAHVLDVEFHVPARTTGPAGEFTLPLLPVPAGRLSFTLPAGENLLVRVNGATGTFRLRDQDGARLVDTAVDRGGDVTLAWQPKAMRGAATGVVHVEVATAIQVNDAGLHLSTGLMYRVRQGAINDVSFALPAGLNVQKVAGPDVGGWELAADGEARTLRVFLRRAIETETQLTLDFYQPLAVSDEPASFQVPPVVPQDVTRETGVVALYAPAHLALRVDTTTGVAQINLNQFTAPVMPVPPTYAPELARAAYRYTARPWGITSAVSRRKAETRAVAEHGANVGLRKLMIASRIQFELTGAPRPAVSVVLPSGYLPIDVASDHLTDWYVTDAAGGTKVLTIEFDQPRTGSVELLLEGHVSRQPDDAAVSVAVPRPLEVSRLESSLAVWLDTSYTAVLQAFDGWRSVDPGSLSDRLRGLNQRAVQFAFSATGLEPPAVSLALTRATPQLTADAVTLIAVTDTSLDYGFTLRWKITQAAADTFTLTTPGWLKGRMEFTGAGVRQVTSADLEDGRVRWTIALVDAVRDEYLLTAVATLPPPADQQVAAPDVQFEQAGAPGAYQPLETQAHHVIVVNLSLAQLAPVDPNQIDAVSREALPLVVRDDLLNQAMEIVRVGPNKLPVWRMERLQQAEAATATVTAAQLVSVLEYDGSWRLEATYSVRNRGQQFLALRIPEGARILSVYVRDRPSRTVTTTLGTETIQLVALPQTSIADLSFDVKLVLAGQLGNSLPERFRLTAQELALPVPAVISREEAAAAGRADLGMPVIETQWRVFLPEDIDAAPVDDKRRTNVTFDEAAWLLEQEKLYQDATALLTVIRNPAASIRSKTQAASNLKQIGLALHNYQGRYQAPSGERPESTVYFARNEQVLKELSDEVQKFEATRGEDAGVQLFDQSESTVQQDEGRQYILGNTAQIASDNPIEGRPGADRDMNFNFRGTAAEIADIEARKSAAGKEGGKDFSKSSSSRGKLREQIADNRGIEDAVKQQLELNAPVAQGGEMTQQQGQSAARYRQMFADPAQVQQQMPMANYLRDDIQFVPPGQTSAGIVGRETWAAPTDAWLIPAQAGGQLADGTSQTATVAAPTPWTSAGGLSLAIDVPRHAQELTFSKVGGDPQLTLALRPRRTLTLGLGALWTLAWIVGGLWVARVLARAGARGTLVRAVPRVLIALGLLGFFLTPIPALRWTLFALFAVGLVCAAFQYSVRSAR